MNAFGFKFPLDTQREQFVCHPRLNALHLEIFDNILHSGVIKSGECIKNIYTHCVLKVPVSDGVAVEMVWGVWCENLLTN